VIVLVPYTAEKLHLDTVRRISEHVPDGVDVAWRELDPNDPTAYARLLVEAWAWDGDLLIVEHDIGIHAGVIEALTECRQPWCGFPYPIGAQLLVCLGCTRFTAHLKATLPDLMAQAAAVDQDGGLMPAGDWRRMDVRIGALLEAHGHNRHPHLPAVEHFHQYPSGG
jgi:hypothetical protein